MIEYPSGFGVSSRAPSKPEMIWLDEWLKQRSWKPETKILEFGCGITTWVISNAIPERTDYYCVEGFEPCVNQVKEHVDNVEFISTTWDDIPQKKYDLAFVDASSCPPKGLVSILGKGERVFRDDAIHYVMDFVSDDCFFIIHDWCYKGGWLRPQQYFTNRNYRLIASLKARHGLGIYQKGQFCE